MLTCYLMRQEHLVWATCSKLLVLKFWGLWTDSKQAKELGTIHYVWIHRNNAFWKGRATTMLNLWRSRLWEPGWKHQRKSFPIGYQLLWPNYFFNMWHGLVPRQTVTRNLCRGRVKNVRSALEAAPAIIRPTIDGIAFMSAPIGVKSRGSFQAVWYCLFAAKKYEMI